MNSTREYQRFSTRHYRGFSSTAPTVIPSMYGERVCGDCGVVHVDSLAADVSRCFDCGQLRNPYAAKAIRMSVDATGEDSDNPQRIAEGTAGDNLALPPVMEPTGVRDAYGQMKMKARPVTHNEVGGARGLREAAKRANLTVLETSKRALPR